MTKVEIYTTIHVYSENCFKMSFSVVGANVFCHVNAVEGLCVCMFTSV